MINQKLRDAIVKKLPEHAFMMPATKEHLDVHWSTKSGIFSLTTAQWSREMDWDVRVTIKAVSSGEEVTLRTESVERIISALELLGAL
jgi:hypothetical protein